MPCVSCANAICSAESCPSPSFFPFAAAESGNMLNAVLSMICVSLGAIACATAPATPSRVAKRTEVIELHSPLEIVKAIERVDDSTTDRTAGVVDQVIAGAVILEHSGNQ